MGDEIHDAHFSLSDFARFETRLEEETALLRQWFRDRVFASAHAVGGYELETWLVDRQWLPAPRNAEFLTELNDGMVVPELARFNVEFNTVPATLEADALSRMEKRLRATWSAAGAVAQNAGMRLLMIGTLPTATHDHMCLDNMSDRTRFRALNDQVLRLRQQTPIRLDIAGAQQLCIEQSDVMLEAAATSLQVHMQVDQSQAAKFYNAAQVAAGPLVAASCNSPFLFGKDLWSETRIPLFEQAVNTARPARQGVGSPPRVGFGDAYLDGSLLELFDDNLERFPVLLPDCSDNDEQRLKHLRLHNGTIWRWNRPLIGFGDNAVPHLRIEHRVIPAGPSLCDIVANSALFFGLANGLVAKHPDFERQLPFASVRQNFYLAARNGLDAKAQWWQGGHGGFDALILDHVLPLAREGLLALNLDMAEADHYLDVVAKRVRTRRTGTDWQRAFVAKHGGDMRALTAAYWERQESGDPVCDWEL